MRPGEVPYVVVPPEQDSPEIGQTLTVEAPGPVVVRDAWDALTGLFG